MTWVVAGLWFHFLQQEMLGGSPAHPFNTSDCRWTPMAQRNWKLQEVNSLCWSQLCFFHSFITTTKQSSSLESKIQSIPLGQHHIHHLLLVFPCFLWGGLIPFFLHLLPFWCFHSQRWLCLVQINSSFHCAVVRWIFFKFINLYASKLFHNSYKWQHSPSLTGVLPSLISCSCLVYAPAKLQPRL